MSFMSCLSLTVATTLFVVVTCVSGYAVLLLVTFSLSAEFTAWDFIETFIPL